MYNKKFWFF